MDIIETENHIELKGSFEVLSSAPLNGGSTDCNRIINMNVDGNKKENEDRLISETFMDELDLDKKELKKTVGFMTGADVTRYYRKSKYIDGREIQVIITAGIGGSLDAEKNTINIIIATELNLSEAGMANLFIVATEAKSNALRKLEITNKLDIVTGTPTDAVAIAKTQKNGEKIDYTGVATSIGQEVYKLVEEGVLEALKKQENLKIDRPVLDKLNELGISLNDITEAAFSLYEGKEPTEKEKEEFKSLVQKKCKDENVKLLIESSIYLGRKTRYLNKEDPAYIVSDELIGIQIAEYIGGKNALFNFTRYDKQKPGILKELDKKDIFLDDAIGGLISGCMTRVFE